MPRTAQRWWPTNEAPGGVSLGDDGRLRCNLCGETDDVSEFLADERARYHVGRHNTHDPFGGPDADFPGYGWVGRQERESDRG